MPRSLHFRQFAASSVLPIQALPPEMQPVEGLGLQLWVHAASDWAVSKAGTDWVFLTGLAFHLEAQLDLKGLADRLLVAEEPLDEIDMWSGWFAVVHSRGGQVHAYHDAAAGHKVYHRSLPGGGQWLGSDPMLSAHWAELQPHTDEDKRTLHASDWWRKRGTMVGDMTPFDGVKQVVANHRFDWNAGVAERVFPRRDRVPMGADAAIDWLLPRLENVMEQATRGRQLQLALTAGWDSRVSLAVSRKVADRIQCYTYHRPNMPAGSPDLVIPRDMAAEGVQHRVIPEQADFSHPDWSLAQASHAVCRFRDFRHMLTQFPEFDSASLVIVSSVSEVTKGYLERIPVHNGLQAVRAAHLVEHPAVLAHFEQWMANSQPVVQRHGYRTLDFLHWEQDVTNFAGASMQRGNFSVPLFSPFNCTRILDVMLSTDPALRDHHAPQFHRMLIERAWPELLRYPVNPFPKEKAIRFAKRVGVYHPYKWLDNRLRPRPFKG